MSKYTELQTRKLISRYGGVGSIIETTHGALLIRKFDKWKYFILIKKNKIELEENMIIYDDRLLQRLQYYFPDLNQIVKVPANYSAIYNTSLPKLKNHIVNAEYFPKWMYCNNCGSFMHINDWYKGWKNVYPSKDINKINDSFIPPQCYKCYQKAYKNKTKRRYYFLEQVRFILTAPNGEMRDLPWELWTNLTRSQKNTDGEKQNANSIIFNGKCCNKQDLRYIKSDKFSDFAGIRIQCKNPECKTKGEQVSLVGLFGLRYPDFDENGKVKQIVDEEGNIVLDNKGNPQRILFKPVIRSSNSVYYPLITSSLYLPSIIIKKEIKDKVKTLYEDADFTIEQIRKTINKKEELQITKKQIIEILFPENKDFIKEVDYRLREYQYLTTNKSSEDNNLVYEKEISDMLNNFSVKKLLKIKRLKMTSVQTGYSRQEPIDKDLFLENSMDDFIKIGKLSIKAKYTSTEGKHTKLLPGVESFGEGIFIEFAPKDLTNWFKKQYKNRSFMKRLQTLKNNAEDTEYKFSEEKAKMIHTPAYLAKFIFIHTFSHILIKELEFLAGYPSASLSERLYINEKEMQGLLIYTIAGAEGSFGGLISQANSDRFIKILNSALVRAKDCASDPICYNSEGQGIGGLNLAACYSCCLLPETSCEEFNSFLDRALLIDKNFGFYNNNTD